MDASDLARLRADNWFGGLAQGRREALVAHAQIVHLRDGARVYRLGDPPNGLHAVLEGRISLVSYPAPGTEMVSMVVKRGRWFGELSVLDGLERPHDAIATGPARLLRVPTTAISAIAQAEPLFWRELAQLLCMRQRRSLRETIRTRAHGGTERLAALLLADAARDEDGRVRTTQEDIAHMLGLSRPYVNRLLQTLSRRGLISCAYGTITVRDRQGLREVFELS